MNQYEVIIIGGSYAGLSAALALGRSSRRTLIIDNGKPCNRNAPHSHNFITHDGVAPHVIAEKAREQVLKYDTISFESGLVVGGKKISDGFQVQTSAGATYEAKRLLLATGVKDLMLPIPGFEECWAISILHCPYCHGYEVKNQTMGLIANGELGFEFCKMISHWSGDLTLFTNGTATLTDEQSDKVKNHNIEIIETPISRIEHENGKIRRVIFEDNTSKKVTAIFTKLAFQQQCPAIDSLGCELSEQGFVKIDEIGKTSVNGVYAAGDCTTYFRSVSIAVASGTKAGTAINKEFIEEEF